MAEDARRRAQHEADQRHALQKKFSDAINVGGGAGPRAGADVSSHGGAGPSCHRLSGPQSLARPDGGSTAHLPPGPCRLHTMPSLQHTSMRAVTLHPQQRVQACTCTCGYSPSTLSPTRACPLPHPPHRT